jgi:hypothetical protein
MLSNRQVTVSVDRRASLSENGKQKISFSFCQLGSTTQCKATPTQPALLESAVTSPMNNKYYDGKQDLLPLAGILKAYFSLRTYRITSFAHPVVFFFSITLPINFVFNHSFSRSRF